ncbi:MAG: DUF2062 domain-containing protein [Prosthecobacter sp.]|nr:DUF2062 domain-containing protein [Prosthecobacter sp.]
MFDLVRGFFRRTVFKTIRFLKHPRKLKQSGVMRWFALHFLNKRVWKPTQHTLAGGVAVGTFITLQLLPIQMPSATVLAAIFRVNIPVAIVMCWASNPFTLAALVPLEYKVGKWALGLLTKVPTTPFPSHLPTDVAGMWMALKEHAPVMLFGGVVLGAVLAPIAYALTYLSWGWLQHWNRDRHEPRLPLRQEREE